MKDEDKKRLEGILGRHQEKRENFQERIDKIQAREDEARQKFRELKQRVIIPAIGEVGAMLVDRGYALRLENPTRARQGGSGRPALAIELRPQQAAEKAASTIAALDLHYDMDSGRITFARHIQVPSGAPGSAPTVRRNIDAIDMDFVSKQLVDLIGVALK